MASTSETGHYKNIRSLETLKTYIAELGKQYNPVAERLQLTAVADLITQAEAALKQLKDAKAALREVQNERQAAFADIPNFASRIVNAMKNCDMNEGLIANAQNALGKIRGKRTAAAKAMEKESGAVRSVSQQSYDMRVDHLSNLYAAIEKGNYTVNEPDISVTALADKITLLKSLNEKAASMESTFTDRLAERNTILYGARTGVVDVGKDIKAYVSQLLGAKHPIVRKFAAVPFRTITTN